MSAPTAPSQRRASTIAGWGGVGVEGVELRSEDLESLTLDVPLTRGLGRSYGDASLPPPGDRRVAATPLADRILAFDPQSGVLRAEAGLALATVNRLFQGRGFYSPVTPGTQQITLGGMVAADVHGKNHHRSGSTGAHLLGLRLRTGDGRLVDCSPQQEPDLFRATIGGMGLTGHILEVELRLEPIPSPWVFVESERIDGIDEFIVALREAASGWPYTMGWIDCVSGGRRMGRGILARGRWARPDEAPERSPKPLRRPSVPFVLPSGLVNPATVRLFDEAVFRAHVPRVRRGIRHPEAFFYPLDAIGNWNRGYGRRGFTQYQCVLPEAAAPQAARRLLEILTSRGGASMTCVIKDCGEQGVGLLSFPLKGLSLAVDIPLRADSQALVDALNEETIAAGGRVYLAKDLLTRARDFRRMDSRIDRFLEVRRRYDPAARLRSQLSVRLLGDPE